MPLGCFSISLSVKDLTASREFYEKLGFEVFAGEADHHFLIMKNGDCNIGLFENMFEGNLLTFNPGWDQDARPLDEFTDVRDLRNVLQAKGVDIVQQAIETDTGPASFSVIDPDGNVVLIDQHV